MKLEVGGTAHDDLLDTDDDLHSDAPSVASSVAPSDTPSDTPSVAPSVAPSDTSSDTPSEASSDTPSGTLREASSTAPGDDHSDSPNEESGSDHSDPPNEESGSDHGDDHSETPNEESGSAHSNALSHARIAAPNDAPGSISSDSSSDSSSESSSDSSKKVPISNATPSDGITFHMQVATSEAEAESAEEEPRGAQGLRGVRERLQGWQCDMRAWAAAFVGAALLFVVLVVALSFALTDFTSMLPDQNAEPRHAMETPLPTKHPLKPIRR